MNRIAQSIKNRLSLRPPQADSLNILAELPDKLTLKKHAPDPYREGNTLSSDLETVKSAYPTCTDFERNFPSLCFALATGVDKVDKLTIVAHDKFQLTIALFHEGQHSSFYRDNHSNQLHSQ